MLTREEAKNCYCPYFGADYLQETINNILVSGDTEEDKKEMLKAIVETSRCKVENCPKWKDEFVQYENTKSHCSNLDCDKCGNIEDYQKHCLNCPKHFGRCAG